jgi:hypothetical protein
MTDPIEINELRQLAEAAIKGPWVACGHDRGGCSCGFVFSASEDVPVAQVTIGVWGDEYPQIRVVEGENVRRRNHPPDPPTIKLEPYLKMIEYGAVPERLGKANAAFIAAANPSTIINLLDEIERLRARVATLKTTSTRKYTMTDETKPTDYPGQWQATMVQRLMTLGYAGFSFGPGDNWWPIDHEQKKVAGPFKTTIDFDAWLTRQEQGQ